MASETFNVKRKRLLIHPGNDPTTVSVIYLDEENIVLTDPSNKNSVAITKDYGVGIQGPLSIQASPDQVRFAGLWKINPLVLTCLPSSIYTPIPWLKQSIPSPPKELTNGIVQIATLISVVV